MRAMKNSADHRYPRPSRQQNIRAMLIVGGISLAVCVTVFLAQLTIGVPDLPQGSDHEATDKSNP
jgi:hypothetical protein